MFEALWNSMYQRLYRSLTLNEGMLTVAGNFVTHIKSTSTSLINFIEKFQAELQSTLNKSKESRSDDEIRLIMSIMNLKSSLKG